MGKWLHLGVLSALLLAAALLVANFFIGHESQWEAIYTYRERAHSTFGQYDIHLKRDGIEVAREEDFHAYKTGLILVDKFLLGVKLRYIEDHITCGGSGASSLRIFVSSWTLAALILCYPVIFFIRSYRRRRVNRYVLRPCDRCGYDLQGNESGTCPECGTAITLRTNAEVTG